MRENIGYKYRGKKDPGRSKELMVSEHRAFHYVKRYMKKIEEIPPIIEEFSEANPLALVSVHFIMLGSIALVELVVFIS